MSWPEALLTRIKGATTAAAANETNNRASSQETFTGVPVVEWCGAAAGAIKREVPLAMAWSVAWTRIQKARGDALVRQFDKKHVNVAGKSS
jgi:hypothetical protein